MCSKENTPAAGHQHITNKINGITNWGPTSEYPLQLIDENHFQVSNVTLKSGDEFKVRKGDTWYPSGGNTTPTKFGKVTIDYNHNTIEFN